MNRRRTNLIDRESTDASPPIVVKDFKTVDVKNANDQWTRKFSPGLVDLLRLIAR